MPSGRRAGGCEKKNGGRKAESEKIPAEKFSFYPKRRTFGRRFEKPSEYGTFKVNNHEQSRQRTNQTTARHDAATGNSRFHHPQHRPAHQRIRGPALAGTRVVLRLHRLGRHAGRHPRRSRVVDRLALLPASGRTTRRKRHLPVQRRAARHAGHTGLSRHPCRPESARRLRRGGLRRQLCRKTTPAVVRKRHRYHPRERPLPRDMDKPPSQARRESLYI